MSNTDWSIKQTTPQLEKLELKNSIKVLIPDEVRDKIKFLCKNIAKVEWSGVLFYDIEGDIRNSSKMIITLKDILLMDKGTQAYTSFNWDEDVVNYRMDNPESLDWFMGHIHSHNTMSVFFSGTDWSELNDNCTQHNFYLSVIVNNYLDIIGKIAISGQSQAYICKDKHGKDYQLKVTNTTSKPTMLVYSCEIEMDYVPIEVPDNFKARYDKIEELATKAADKAEANRKSTVEQQAGYHKKAVKNPIIKTDRPYYLELKNSTGKKIHEQSDDEWNKTQKEEQQFTQQTIDQEFATYVLRLGNVENLEDDELEEAIEDIELSGINIKSFSESVDEMYGVLYDRFFDKLPAYHNDESFLYVTEKVVEALEEHLAMYEFLDPIINTIKMLGTRLEQTLKENETAKA